MEVAPPDVFSDAVRFFWDKTGQQRRAQDKSGDVDRGRRGAVTGGKQMHGFITRLTEPRIWCGISFSVENSCWNANTLLHVL
jgi:hypothetical protein